MAGMKYLTNLFKDEMASVASETITTKFETCVDSGDPSLNWALGGGWAQNRINIAFGPSGSAKSAISAFGAGKAQRKRPGSIVLVIDSEFYYYERPDRVERLGKFGLDLENTMVISGNTVDDCFGNLVDIENLMKEGKIDVSAMIIDSWSGIENLAAAKKLEDNKDGEGASSAGNSHRGNAKVMNPILQRISALTAKYKITCFIIQHVMINQEMYGPKYLLLGGEKFKHLADNILFVESVAAKDARLGADDEVATDGDLVVGKKIRAKLIKTRSTVEGKQVEVWMNFIECRFAKPEESLLLLATNLGVIRSQIEVERDDNGNPVVDKKTGKEKGKEKKGWMEYTDAEGNMSWYGKAKIVEALKKPEFFARVQHSCLSLDVSEIKPAFEMSEAGV